MYRTLLSFELRSISPEAKFFLVRFVQRYGVAESVQMSVKELAKATGATDRVVSRSVTELMAADLLNHRAIADGRGRPKSKYQCSSRLAELLEEKCRKTVLAHEARIDHVLHGASGQDDAELNITNRLLLAALLDRADQFGAVRDLGLSDLSKRTGLNRERVKAQLHKLHSLGVIRSTVPGATSSKLFGPTKSIYFLNLHNPALSLDGHAAIVLIRTSEKYRELIGPNEASWIIQAADECNGDTFDINIWMRNFLPNDEKFKSLAPLFYPRTESLKLAQLLQTKIEEYASTLLSKHWKTLPVGTSKTQEIFLDSEIVEHIRKDFKPTAGAIKHSTTNESPNEHITLLAEFIYHIAFRLACRTKKIFPDIENMSFKKIDFLILPSSSLGRFRNIYTGSRAILIIPHEYFGERLCYVMKGDEYGIFNREEFTTENNIPIENRFRFGLLTKSTAPKRYGQRASISTDHSRH